jgi:hypothetical protein
MRAFWFRSVPALALAALVALTVAADEPLPVQQQPVKRQPIKRPPIKGGAKSAVVAEQQLSDEEALKKAKLTETDGGKLIEYLQQRTLTETEQGRIASVIKRFGADDFEERVRATEEIEAFGTAAVGPLKAAAKDSDPEVAYRARVALSRVETVPHSAVAAAAVRAVVKLKPDGAAAALIGFLPMADDEGVADVIRDALVSLAVGKDGKADPALVAALADASPVRRSAAYAALTLGGSKDERIRVKDAYPKVREAVLKETDLDTKFVGLWSLALTTREKEYLGELVTLIPKLPRGRIWQLEDLLLQVAGSHPKDGRFLKSPESLTKTRDAWLAWWKEKGQAIDLTKVEYKQRVAGFTDILELDANFGGPGRIVSLGHDLKERWRITGINGPTDARVAPNGHVFVVESGSNRVVERGTNGAVFNTRNIYQQPVNVNVLPDGGQVVVCRNNVFQFDKDGKQSWVYTRNNFDIMTGHVMPNGDTLVVTLVNNGGQVKSTGIRIDGKGKETGKTYTFGLIQNLHTMDVIDDDTVLVCEGNAVAEYDLKTGKRTWKHDCNQPSSCQRLFNGNTLITLMNQGSTGRVIEVDPSGEIVWEYEGRDRLRAGRAYRR